MADEVKWSIDTAHSEVAFKVKHLMIASVRGMFKTFDADIRTTGMDFTTATIDFTIDPSSLVTGDEKRDDHMKSPDFFDAYNYKEISFVSNTFTKLNNESNTYELWGELTIRGITKNIKLIVEFGGLIQDPWGNDRAGFSVKGKINRKDWDLTWNSTLEGGGVLVGDEVKIMCEIQVVRVKNDNGEMELKSSQEKKGVEL